MADNPATSDAESTAKFGRGLAGLSLIALGAISFQMVKEGLFSGTTEGIVERVGDAEVVVSYCIPGKHRKESTFPLGELDSVPRAGDAMTVHYVYGHRGTYLTHLEGARWYVFYVKSMAVALAALIVGGILAFLGWTQSLGKAPNQ